jgi:hypothetical protein
LTIAKYPFDSFVNELAATAFNGPIVVQIEVLTAAATFPNHLRALRAELVQVGHVTHAHLSQTIRRVLSGPFETKKNTHHRLSQRFMVSPSPQIDAL